MCGSRASYAYGSGGSSYGIAAPFRGVRVGGSLAGVDALLIIDFQNDFCPGGALAVDEGDRIVEAVDPLLDRFELVVATRDWHPRDHGSFAGVEVDPAT